MNQLEPKVASLPKVYRASKGWRIFFLLAAPPMIVFGGYIMLLPLIEGRADEIGYLIPLLIIGGSISILLFSGMISILKWRIEILPDRFREVGVFKTKEIIIAEVEGINILPTSNFVILQFIYKDPHAKKVKIGLLMEKRQEFAEWIDANFKNFTAEVVNQEVNQIAANPDLGSSEEERMRTLQRAERWSKFINGVGIATIIWAFFPVYYEWAIWVLIAMPIIVIFSIRFFRGAIRFDSNQYSAYPAVVGTFLMPCMGLALRALFDWQILNWQPFWMLFAFFSLLIYGLLLLSAADLRKSKVNKVLALVFCMVYGYGVTITLNGVLDRSVPVAYQAMIIDKRVSTGKTTSYYFEVFPWGPKIKKNEVQVERSKYEVKNTGDEVQIMVRRGYFEIPWFYVR